MTGEDAAVRAVRARVCPRCGSEPLPVTWVLPWFCPDPDCAVFSWDPYADPAEFEGTAKVIDLPAPDGAPR